MCLGNSRTFGGPGYWMVLMVLQGGKAGLAVNLAVQALDCILKAVKHGGGLKMYRLGGLQNLLTGLVFL